MAAGRFREDTGRREPEDSRRAALAQISNASAVPPGLAKPPFIKNLLELGPRHDVGRACIVHLENICSVVTALAEEAALRAAQEFARSWHILMKGPIVSASEGEREARRAKAMARLFNEQYR